MAATYGSVPADLLDAIKEGNGYDEILEFLGNYDDAFKREAAEDEAAMQKLSEAEFEDDVWAAKHAKAAASTATISQDFADKAAFAKLEREQEEAAYRAEMRRDAEIDAAFALATGGIAAKAPESPIGDGKPDAASATDGAESGPRAQEGGAAQGNSRDLDDDEGWADLESYFG